MDTPTLTEYLWKRSEEIRRIHRYPDGYSDMPRRLVKRLFASTQTRFHRYLEKLGENPEEIAEYSRFHFIYKLQYILEIKTVAKTLFNDFDIDKNSVHEFIICHHQENEVSVKSDPVQIFKSRYLNNSILRDLGIQETSRYCIFFTPFNIFDYTSCFHITDKYNVYIYYLADIVRVINMVIKFTIYNRRKEKKNQVIIDYKINNIRNMDFLTSFREKSFFYKQICNTFYFKDLMKSCDYDQKADELAYFVRLCFAYQINTNNLNICMILGKDVGLTIAFYVSKLNFDK